MDLATFAASSDEGATLELKDPAGEPLFKDDGSTPVTIKLAGSDSKRWRKAEDTVGDKRLKAAKSGGVKSMEELRDQNAFLLASVTLSWDGIVVHDKELECNLENAKRLYLDYAWVREQVDSFVGDRRNFLTASSRN